MVTKEIPLKGRAQESDSFSRIWVKEEVCFGHVSKRRIDRKAIQSNLELC